MRLLTSYEESRTINVVPFQPKSGQLFVYRASLPNQIDDWRCDGHRWVNQRTAKLPKRSPQYRKSYFYFSNQDHNGHNIGMFYIILIEMNSLIMNVN